MTFEEFEAEVRAVVPGATCWQDRGLFVADMLCGFGALWDPWRGWRERVTQRGGGKTLVGLMRAVVRARRSEAVNLLEGAVLIEEMLAALKAAPAAKGGVTDDR